MVLDIYYTSCFAARLLADFAMGSDLLPLSTKLNLVFPAFLRIRFLRKSHIICIEKLKIARNSIIPDFRRNRILDPESFAKNHFPTKTELTKKYPYGSSCSGGERLQTYRVTNKHLCCFSIEIHLERSFLS